MKHINAALFVPHEGCPHRCSFCNQRSISGETQPPGEREVEQVAETALRCSGEAAAAGEIAFFGGSFTAIERGYMTRLLSAANRFVGEGGFKGIRVSTRPDAVSEEICDILEKYHVTAVELGAQSTDDEVLRKNARGHTAQDIFNAAELLRRRGFELGLQMMTGLFGSSEGESERTARDIISMRPDTVRIYPTIVIENTPLAQLFRRGEYRPQTLDEATQLCAKLLLMFREENIKVIRLGLHSGGGVEEGYIAGPYHPAFRELCESRIFLRTMTGLLESRQAGEYTVFTSPRAVSKAAGQKKGNLSALAQRGFQCVIKPDPALEGWEIRIEKNETR